MENKGKKEDKKKKGKDKDEDEGEESNNTELQNTDSQLYEAITMLRGLSLLKQRQKPIINKEAESEAADDQAALNKTDTNPNTQAQ